MNTQAGGKKAAATMKQKYGEDYYERMGVLGGSAEFTKPRGFAAMSKEKLHDISVKASLIRWRTK